MNNPTKYNPYRDFTTLVAWKKARELKLFLYSDVIPFLPSEEKYNLNIQIRKVAVSATANIAEGYGRYHRPESVQFYRMSRGSIYEAKDHLTSCCDLNYIPQPVFERGLMLIEETKSRPQRLHPLRAKPTLAELRGLGR